MFDAAGQPVSPTAIVQVQIDHGGRLASYLVDRDGFSHPTLVNLYRHAGDLLADLQTLEARDSPTEGSLVERINRHARTVAADPNMEAAIGFIDRNGETGLVLVTSVRCPPPPESAS